jgi:hypothetical protein
MPRYGGPRDANQSDIVKTLEQIPGLKVFDLGAVGDDFPDIIIGYKGVNYLVELKTERGRVSAGQDTFNKEWTGQTDICRSLDEILELISVK